MNSLTDQQLLRDYSECRSEAAFAELVRRHVDFVHSVALRMVRDAHLAQDVTQGVFVALAQNARSLTDRSVLPGWLHRTTHNLASNVIRSDVRRRAREQEAAAMNELLAAEPDTIWQHIAPQLDSALNELSEPDREALLLRYFGRKSARDMAQTLEISDEAAQKRVSRAVERLREVLAKRGVSVSVGGLVVVISANAVQAAPAGLAATISAATVLAGTSVPVSTIAAVTKTVAMTSLQRTFVTAALAVAVGAGIYETRQASTERAVVQALEQRRAALGEQMRQSQYEQNDAANRLVALRDENARLNRNVAELAKLRDEAARLRRDSEELGSLKARIASDPSVTVKDRWLENIDRLKQRLRDTPGASIPELKSLTEQDWFKAANEHKLDSEKDFRKALSELRNLGEAHYLPSIIDAARKYSQANGGRWPADLLQIKPYLKSPIEDAILLRYEIVPAESLPTVVSAKIEGWVITEKAAVDLECDDRMAVSLSMPPGMGYTASGSFEQSEVVKMLTPAIRAWFLANNGEMPTDPAQLAPYVTTADEKAALQKAVRECEKKPLKGRSLSPDVLERLRPK